MFITLEGIEGSGKTTQINYIKMFLNEKGYDCVITKEPGGTNIGEKIRSILLNPDHHQMDPLTELLLYAADRIQHVKEFIIPMIETGKTVICDRFHDSTMAYQGFARGLDLQLIRDLDLLVLGELKPDITFVLDLPAQEGLQRAWKQIENGNRPDAETRFEKEKIIFHEKVRDGYIQLARMEPDRFIVIDATANESAVKEMIFHELDNKLRKHA